MLKASYKVDRVVPQDIDRMYRGMVFIVDLNTGTSITNDAENVVKDVLAKYPEHRIIYRDTQGNWDELLHWNGEFAGFKPYTRI